MSFEDFLNYGFDTGLAGNDFYSLDTQGQQDTADSQMLDFPAGDFDNFSGEALDQSSALAQPDWAPWTVDVASDQLSRLQDTALNLSEPGESA